MVETPKCWPADDWKNVVYPYNGMLLNSQKEVLIIATRWMSLENTELQKTICYKIPFILSLQNRRIYKYGRWISSCLGLV